MRCSRCKMARYCDKNCQKTDWAENHKIVCRTCEYVPVSGASAPMPEADDGGVRL